MGEARKKKGIFRKHAPKSFSWWVIVWWKVLVHLSHLVHLMSSHLMRVRNKSTVVVESYFPADSSIVSLTHTKQINEMKKKVSKETYLELIIT